MSVQSSRHLFARCMHVSLRLFAALCVVPLCFPTTDSLLAKVGESPQQQDRSGPLTNLKSLHIVVDGVNADARKAGITESDLEAQTLVALGRNIPTLTIREGGPFIGITVTVFRKQNGRRSVARIRCLCTCRCHSPGDDFIR